MFIGILAVILCPGLSDTSISMGLCLYSLSNARRYEPHEARGMSKERRREVHAYIIRRKIIDYLSINFRTDASFAAIYYSVPSPNLEV